MQSTFLLLRGGIKILKLFAQVRFVPFLIPNNIPDQSRIISN